MQEIFVNIGPVVRAVVHCDSNGRSLGSAEVEFKQAKHAGKAVDDYDSVCATQMIQQFL